MNTIITTLPVSLDQLKQIITTPDCNVVVNYAESKLKGRAALIYISNVSLGKVTFDVTNVAEDDLFALIDAYVTQKSTVNVPCLVTTVGALLLFGKGIQLSHEDKVLAGTNLLLSDEQMLRYYQTPSRQVNISRLCEVLDNVVTFVLTCSEGFKAECGDTVVFPVIDDIDYTGYTFVNLFADEGFMYQFYTKPVYLTQPHYFTQQFDQYLYGGRNLFSYVRETYLLPTLDLFMSDPSQIEMLGKAVNQSADEETTS